jgi:hypothetical protein
MMAFANPGYVVSVLHNNKPIKEINESGTRTVYLPFDSEYKVRLQNKTKKRCMVSVEIDGCDTNTPGSKFILQAGEKLDLERFLVSGNDQSGPRFKFVRAGSHPDVQDPTSSENGKLRVQFFPEKDWLSIFSGVNQGGCCGCGPNHHHGFHSFINQPNSWNFNSVGGVASGVSGVVEGCNLSVASINSVANSSSSDGGIYTTLLNSSPTFGTAHASFPSVQEEVAGATVGGSESDQAFTTSTGFLTDSPVTIELKLKGVQEKVVPPVTITFQNQKVPPRWNLQVVSIDGNETGPFRVLLDNQILTGLRDVSIESGELVLRIKDFQVTK